MSVLLVILIAIQVLSLALQVLWHYMGTPEAIIKAEGPEFQARVAKLHQLNTTRTNDHKVVGA